MAGWVRYGPHAILLRLADAAGEDAFRHVRAAAAELASNPPDGLLEYVPGFTTLLLRFDPAQSAHLARIGRDVAGRLPRFSSTPTAETPVKDIPVVYDGEDLAALAESRQLSPMEVVGLHSWPIYQVRLLGFSPGFPYLGELDPRLHTPRRATPRPRVAAGSVAIGGEHTGIYSIDSPGGWHVIGRTSVRMFAPERVTADTDPREAFFLFPGDRVKFVPVEAAST